MHKRPLTLFILLSALFLSIAAFTGCTANENENKAISILHTNDVHGYYSTMDATTGKTAEDVIGHDIIAAVYDAYKKDGTAFMLDAGDAIQGIYFVTENDGQAAIEIMNTVGYDAMTLGNHEFDYGWFRLQQLMGDADFPMLTSLDDEEAVAATNLYKTTVIERDGVKLGVFGLTTPETATSSNGGFGRDFGTKETLIQSAKDAVKQLTEEDQVDYVICLSHLGTIASDYGTSYDIRDNVEGIDLIIDGHSHTPLEEIKNEEGKTKITSTGAYNIGLGVANLSKENGKTSVTLETLDQEKASAFGQKAEVTKVIKKWYDEVHEAGSEVVAQIPFDITVARENERTKETVMGDITTDAMREVSGADIAMQNGGSIRDQKLTTGDVTKSQIISIFPYGNVLQMAKVKGSTILAVLEHSVSGYPDTEGRFMQVSGLSFDFNPNHEVGQRVSNVLVGGQPLGSETIYTLCTNDFAAAGGDDYEMLVEPFKNQEPLKNPDLTPLDSAVIWYLGEHQSTLVNETQGRINVLP